MEKRSFGDIRFRAIKQACLSGFGCPDHEKGTRSQARMHGRYFPNLTRWF